MAHVFFNDYNYADEPIPCAARMGWSEASWQPQRQENTRWNISIPELQVIDLVWNITDVFCLMAAGSRSLGQIPPCFRDPWDEEEGNINEASFASQQKSVISFFRARGSAISSIKHLTSLEHNWEPDFSWKGLLGPLHVLADFKNFLLYWGLLEAVILGLQPWLNGI